jgi:hypothetical protein
MGRRSSIFFMRPILSSIAATKPIEAFSPSVYSFFNFLCTLLLNWRPILGFQSGTPEHLLKMNSFINILSVEIYMN